MNWGAYEIDLAPGVTIDLTADLDAISVATWPPPLVTIDIEGNGATIDGGHAHRGLFVYSGNVTINDLTIANATAQGGAGGAGTGGGGGGAGLGGGLFVASAGAVTLDDVAFRNDDAIGGGGGKYEAFASGGGGGGLAETVARTRVLTAGTVAAEGEELDPERIGGTSSVRNGAPGIIPAGRAGGA